MCTNDLVSFTRTNTNYFSLFLSCCTSMSCWSVLFSSSCLILLLFFFCKVFCLNDAETCSHTSHPVLDYLEKTRLNVFVYFLFFLFFLCWKHFLPSMRKRIHYQRHFCSNKMNVTSIARRKQIKLLKLFSCMQESF